MKRLLLFLILVSALASQAQVTFNHGWRIWCEYQQNNMQQTSDGGYILSTDAPPEMDTVTNLDWGYLIKLNALGNQQWIKRFPKSDYTIKAYDGNSICQTSDGGYAIASAFYHQDTTSSFGGVKWIAVIKTDNTGNVQWSASYPGLGSSSAYCIHETSDLGLIISGGTFNPNQSGYCYPYLLKLDSAGTPQWGKYYDDGIPGLYGVLTSVNQAGNGGYIATGYRCDGEGVVLKTDASGNVEWSNCPTVSLYCYCNDVIPLAGGGYLFCGADNNSPLLIRYDNSGAAAWQMIYPAPFNTLNVGCCVVPTWDGYTVSIMSTNQAGYVARLMHTDTIGNPAWGMEYQDTDPLMPIDLEHTTDHGYAFVSSVLAGSSFVDQFVTLVKTDSTGYIPCNAIPVSDSAQPVQYSTTLPMTGYNSAPQTSLSVVFTIPMIDDSVFCETSTEGITEATPHATMLTYPNPAASELNISVSSISPGEVSVHLFNSLGEEVALPQIGNAADGNGGYAIQARIDGLAEGIYLLQLMVNDAVVDTRKVIVQR